MTPINSVGETKQPITFGPRKPVKTEKSGFGQLLTDAVKNINDQQKMADKTAIQVVEGKVGIHEGMMTLAKADISMRAMLKVRTKVLEAYKEIMRMPV
ncbi:MAG: flagellar hook-basal body complex protein FliE [Thermodesulfobacteriota bacterium]|nr:flagellar hook-basal body complex protein FliE [Thermodesulfobacteriota bacterium]